MNSLTRAFYLLKPFIPRSTQLFLRRRIAHRKCAKCAQFWPIDYDAAEAPEQWNGWPGDNQFCLVLSHDVDTQYGHDRALDLAELEEALGFRSSFNFVPERYQLSESLLAKIQDKGFEIGVHGLKHDGKLFSSNEIFRERAAKINDYLDKWQSSGFTAPAMISKQNWMWILNITHAISSFDTDPFEPQPTGAKTIFPYWVANDHNGSGFLELPYTLPQDFTLFIILKESTIEIWKQKLDWIVEQGGMALLNSHPDYMNFGRKKKRPEEYPVEYYKEFLEYINSRYSDRCWKALPGNVAEFWRTTMRVSA